MAIVPTHNPDNIYNLNSSEACYVQKHLIKNWEPAREVWALNYGTSILSICSGATGYIVNAMFRKSLRLLTYGYYSSSFLISIAPAFTTYLTHRQFVVDDLMLYRTNCLLCTELKTFTIMTLNGFLYPLILAPALSLPLAGNLGFRIPYIYEVKELGKFFKSVIVPNKQRLMILFGGNTLVASLIAYKQLQTMKFVEEILLKIGKYMDENKLEGSTPV